MKQNDDVTELSYLQNLTIYNRYYAYLLQVSVNFLPLNPLTTNASHHIETSQLICIANQLTGFYIMGNIGR